MSNDITPFDGYGGSNDLATASASAGNGAVDRPGASGGVQRDTLMHRVHHHLRGRYWIVITLGLILGGSGGYLGYTKLHPIYRAEGMLQISLSKPDPMGSSSAMPNWEEYVQSQTLVLGSRTVMRMAMQGPNWKDTGLAMDGTVQSKIAENLTVDHPPRTELIRVYYTDPDPEVAVAVVKSIVRAYFDFATNRNQMEDTKQLNLLEKRRAAFITSIGNADRELEDAVNAFGIPDLAPLLDAKVQEEVNLESRLNAAKFALEANHGKKDPRKVVFGFTNNQIGIVDPTMRSLLNKRDEVEATIAQFRISGVMEESDRMKAVHMQLDEAQRKVDSYAVEWRDLQTLLSNDPSMASGSVPRMLTMSKEYLQGEVTLLESQYNAVKSDRTKMGQQVLNIQRLRQQREDAEKDKAEVQRRMDLLNMSMSMSSRLQILEPGNVPILPFKDRRIAVSIAAAVGGTGLPVIFFLFLGAMDKRYRFSDETNDGVANVPLLGILPRLPEQLSDPEQAAVAAHCIHQIRIMLQVGPNPDRRRVFMVTSSATGDGKTSLTMALGLSFAASGSKTLVIDCDMVGQGLTHRLKAQDVAGLLETLNTGTLRGHVRKTGTKGLYLLPLGNADAADAGLLSPNSIKRLLAACCQHFDIVVIDTGPILGSLEASAVAAEVDGVIMAVARGQQQPLVEKAIRHLRSIGANIFGIVFNRAEQRDFQRSVSSASIRSVSSVKPHTPRAVLPDTDESARFGPLARSVASCLPMGHGAVNGASNGNGNGHANGNGNGHVNGAGANGGSGSGSATATETATATATATETATETATATAQEDAAA
jgi:polysaccharide biosynthesis transport protein